jgi:hypothetical protein
VRVPDLAEPTTASAVGPQEARPAVRVRVTTLDLLAMAAVLLVALLGWASLALAHLGHHSLPGVLLLTGVGLVAVVGVAVRWARPEVVADRAGVLVALGCVAVALALTVPGFSYGVADKDPGVYVSHGISIARTGDYAIHDELLAHQGQDPSFPVRLFSPGARFPGIWVHDAATGRVVPQFYHLWPAMLATAYDAAGLDGLRATTPVAGALCVLLLCALLRKVGELVAPRVGLAMAAIGGLLLATNMMQVWQSRYPTTEALAEALFLGALLGLVLALKEGWVVGAGLAGLLVGVSFLNRADGVLLVAGSAALGAVVLTLGRWDGRAWWYAAGLGLVLPHALVQAYDLAKGYSLGNGVPSLRTLAVLCAGVLLVGAVLGRLLRTPVGLLQRRLLDRRTQVVLGGLVVLTVMGLIGLGFLRPKLFGADMMDYNGRLIRSYDEQALRRLSWFFTLPAFAVLPFGVAVVALRRWSATLWAVIVPTLLLLPLYAYAARNSSRLMWWPRRFVPTVLPGVVVLLVLAIGFALAWRYRGRALLRVPALLAAAGLLGAFLQQSLPLRRHDEFAGSFDISARIAALAHGQHGIFLWEQDGSCCSGPAHLFPATLWLQHGQDSVLLLADDPQHGQSPAAMIAAYRAAFPQDPLFVVSGRGALPAGVAPDAVEEVADLRASLPMWDESDEMRPRAAHHVPVHVQVWHVQGTGHAGG